MRALLVSFFVFLCAMFMTYFGYMEWNKQTNNQRDIQTIELNGSSSFQISSSFNQQHLVPQGAVLKENDVTEITKSYLVKHDENSQFDISISEVKFIHNELQYYDDYNLLQFQVNTEIIDSQTTKLTITIALRMPETQAQYEIVSGSYASYNISLHVI